MRKSEVLLAESVACLNAALCRLKDIWEEIGIPEDQRVQRTESVKNYMKGLLDMMISEEESLRNSLRTSIAKGRTEAEELRKELQLPPFQAEVTGTMLQVDKDLRTQVEALLKQKSQRLQELQALKEQDLDLCDILCTEPHAIIPDQQAVPSLQQLQGYRQHLANLTAEKENRRREFVGLKKNIVLSMEDLEHLPDTSFEREVVHEDEDAFCLSKENIASLRLLLSKLEERKAENAERCGFCRSRIQELWERLEVCQEERGLLGPHMSCSQKRNLNALQAELSRLEELKLDRIRELVKDMRVEMASYWDLCFLSAEQQQAFAPYCSDDFTEELLAVHKSELLRLRQAHEAHRELFDGVKRWEDSWRLFLQLEVCRDMEMEGLQDASVKMSYDPQWQQIRPDSSTEGGNLLKEEKQRAELLKSLTKLEKMLKVQTDAWREQEGREFLVRGQNFQQFVEAHWELHRSEKEREKLERHLKKSRQMEEDMLYGTVKLNAVQAEAPRKKPHQGKCEGSLGSNPGSTWPYARTLFLEQNKENISKPNTKDLRAACGSPATPLCNVSINTVASTYSEFARELSKVSKSPCKMEVLNSTPES